MSVGAALKLAMGLLLGLGLFQRDELGLGQYQGRDRAALRVRLPDGVQRRLHFARNGGTCWSAPS